MSGLIVPFKGFVPKKPGARTRFFAEEANSAHALVAYESPLRLAETLGVALDALGDREAAVALEMTKLHERCLRGTLASLITQLGTEPQKGEAVLVIAPLPRKLRQEAPDED